MYGRMNILPLLNMHSSGALIAVKASNFNVTLCVALVEPLTEEATESYRKN